MVPQEGPELGRRDSIGVQTPVGFDPPAEIRTAPRPEAISFRRPPQETDHALIKITAYRASLRIWAEPVWRSSRSWRAPWLPCIVR